MQQKWREKLARWCFIDILNLAGRPVEYGSARTIWEIKGVKIDKECVNPDLDLKIWIFGFPIEHKIWQRILSQIH